jgi:hypothetical protein
MRIVDKTLEPLLYIFEQLARQIDIFQSLQKASWQYRRTNDRYQPLEQTKFF